ncbi:MAG: hypothetical protein CFK52_14030, partial [Chloracidobacterium sp. CP2_5A]
MRGQDIQTLLLQVEATTELLRSELRRGAQSIDDLERRGTRAGSSLQSAFARIGAAAASLRSALGGLGVAAGGVGLSAFGRSALRFADDLQTAAERAGLSVESYQRVREALRGLELDADQTNKVLERLVLVLGNAQAGQLASAQAAALERLGVAGRIASGGISDTAGLLDELGRAADSYSSRAQFAADISAVVGDRLGPKLAAALADGGAAYRELAAAATIASDAQVEALARANEALERAGETFRRLTVQVAGNAVILFERFREAGRRVEGANFGVSLLDSFR